MNWQTLQIKNLGKIVTGKTPSTNNNYYFDGQFPFVTPTDITFDNYYCRKTETTVTETAKHKHRNQFIPSNSVMVTCIGSTIGKCALSSEECLTNQQINTIVPFDIYDPKYVYYLMIYNVEIIRGIGLSGGVAAPIINKTTFESIKIKVHSKNSREAISSILSSYDDLIDANRRRIQLLEESARLLFREWFVHFHFPRLRQGFGGQAGHEKVKIVDGVPEGWKRGLLEDIAVVKKGRNITFEQAVEGDIPVVGGGLEPTYYHNQANVSAPAITISASGANAGYVNMYDTDIWASDCSYIDKISTKHFYCLYLRLKSLQTAIFGFQVGVAQPHVYPRNLNRLSLLVAPEDLCVQFEQLVGPIFNLIKNLKLENQKLAQARDLLLPRLMSGAIEV